MLVLAIAALLQGPDPSAIIARAAEKYRAISSFRAEFRQDDRRLDDRNVRKSGGVGTVGGIDTCDALQ